MARQELVRSSGLRRFFFVVVFASVFVIIAVVVVAVVVVQALAIPLPFWIVLVISCEFHAAQRRNSSTKQADLCAAGRTRQPAR